MILAILDLYIASMPPIKFLLHLMVLEEILFEEFPVWAILDIGMEQF